MANKQREPIKVLAFVNINGKEYNLDEMTPEQRSFVGTHIKIRYLNGLFAGKAEFYPTRELPDVKEFFPD